MKNPAVIAGRLTRCAALFFLGCQTFAADPSTDQRIQQLEQQNQSLQQTLLKQQGMIEDLARKISELTGKMPETGTTPDEAAKKKYDFGAVRVSGEGGLGIFHTSSGGRFNHADFRVDEAKLFLEAPLWENFVFAYAELDLLTRERGTAGAFLDDSFHLGEIYVDFEGFSRLWGKPGMLGVRIGRLDIPFGEEYIARDVIDNPLISHSLSDIWGVDEGVELYGKTGQFDYVFAVQNGGHPALADWNRDKALVGRIGWSPNKKFRLSASAMRTGDLDVKGDGTSELWFGSGFLRNISGSASLFQAAVYEGDAQYFWDTGHIKGAGGYIDLSDNGGANRHVYYYLFEALQRLPQHPKLYGAGRFSGLYASGGFPIVGNGAFGAYFFNPGLLTERMWRVSIGPGYNFTEHLSLKLEYTLDRRHVVSDYESQFTHFLAAEVGFSF